MERRAAVDYLLEIAEKTNNSKFSSIVNDLARRVALSLEDKNVNLEKYCSKMAAELMFRDDYTNANRLMKIAQDATAPPANVLPLPPENQNTSNVKNDLPKPVKPIMQPLDKNKLAEFIKNLENGGADIVEQSTNQDTTNPEDPEKTPVQTEAIQPESPQQ
jgi:hypothetical protein